MTIEEIRKLKEKADAGDAIACINYSKAVFDRREEKPQFYFSRCWTAIRYLSKADEFGHFDEETRKKNVRNAARVMEMLINRNYGENIKTSDMVNLLLLDFELSGIDDGTVLKKSYAAMLGNYVRILDKVPTYAYCGDRMVRFCCAVVNSKTVDPWIKSDAFKIIARLDPDPAINEKYKTVDDFRGAEMIEFRTGKRVKMVGCDETGIAIDKGEKGEIYYPCDVGSSTVVSRGHFVFPDVRMTARFVDLYEKYWNSEEASIGRFCYNAMHYD